MNELGKPHLHYADERNAVMLTLGIDSSTQGTKAVVFDVETGRVVASASVNYGKDLPEACAVGVRLASSVICSLENTCPHFLPSEFGFDP